VQGTSDIFQQLVQTTHEAVCEVDIIQNGKVVLQLVGFDGQVTADRTAAQMRSATVSVADPDGTLTPVDMASALAPFGTRMQIKRGVRIPGSQLLSRLDTGANGGFAQGTNVGTVADATTGYLRIGP
jgi:hypothetical protein